MEIRKIDQLDERSEQVRDVLERLPVWIIQWGITVVFFCLVVLVLISWLLKYPDVISAQITITTSNPPASIVARAAGKLESIYVQDQDTVQPGSLLASIVNTADLADVVYLKKQLDSLASSPVSFVERLALGEVQEAYTRFVDHYRQFRYYQEFDPLKKEMWSIKRQIREHQRLLSAQTERHQTHQQQFLLAEKDHQRNQQLFRQGTIAARERENSEQTFLIAKSSREGAQLEMIQTEIRLTELQSLLGQLTLQNQEKEDQLQRAYVSSLGELQSAIATWEHTYLLQAPIAGSVSFFRYWSKNHVVEAGDEVMTVVPLDSLQIVGELLMPLRNSGKVKVGHRVNIQLDNYPYEEFGMIQGTVQSISLIPRDNLYAIRVAFPKGLVTNYQRNIPFHQRLQGTAEVIVDDLRLIQRIFYGLRSLTES